MSEDNRLIVEPRKFKHRQSFRLESGESLNGFELIYETYGELNKEKSNIFRDEQINYINKSINYLKGKIDNPTFYLWSNDLDNIDMSMFNSQIIKIHHNPEAILDVDKRSLDLFLISQCSHHIVIPSSFNWWGALLCKKNNKIICRPAENLFSTFKINNLDFWPNDWIKIS